MQLYKIRGGDKESLEAKKYDICVGISLGNKWFSPENIVGLIEWSLVHTKEFVVVCPADDIHAINVQARTGRSRESSLRVAKRMSDELMSLVKVQADSRFTDTEKERIIYATWSDVVSEEYQKKVEFLYGEYKNNHDFRLAIQNIIRSHISKESRTFSDEAVNMLGMYILEELPEVAGRVPVKGITYEAYVYPHDGTLTEFIEQIQKRKIFPEIGKVIVGDEPKVFLEVR